MVGESVTLEIQRSGDIEWKFRSHNILIAYISRDEIKLQEKVLDGSFRGRLTLDQTGSLTINNTRTTDSGEYKAIMTSTGILLHTFKLTVHAPLPIPVISTYLSPCPNTSSESRCVLLCSVVNVRSATLSWYKGNSVLSSTSASDLSISLSLPLEVELQDKSTYSCVVSNPISNQTTHLDIDTLCNTCSDGLFPKAVILLVLSAVVGVAAAVVPVLVYKLISRCLQKKKSVQEEAKITYSSIDYGL
nr:CD48 antigen [Danio rerio]|eukprot:XP_017208771.1 CD48 antigen [Danio rerio]